MREFTERTSGGLRALGWCLSILLAVSAAGCRKETPPAPEPNDTATPAATELQMPPIETPTEEPQEPEVVVVTVNGDEITEKELAMAVDLQIRRADPRVMQLSPERLEQRRKLVRTQVLDILIAERLLNGQIEAAGIVVTDEEVVKAFEAQGASLNPPKTLDEIKAILLSSGLTFEEAKEQYRQGLSRRKLLEARWAGKVDVNDADAQVYYDRNIRQFEIPEQVRASHILTKPQILDPNSDPNLAKVAARAKAENLLAQIKDGADFAELAKAHSADRATAPRGGDLDFFTRERMVKPFADAAFAMQPGEVSDIVETQYGYHIIKVTERKEATVRPFEEVKAAIVQHLTTQKRTEIAKEYVDELREKATIVYVSGEQPGAAEPAPSTLEAPPMPADPNAG